jgi:Bcr/CflA subfamily drug resistance transporter
MKKTISILFPLLLVLYELAAYLSNDMYLPALPQMMREFHASYSSAQTTLTSWFLGAASMQLILGPISDRYGRRPVLLFGGLLFVIPTLLCGITTDINVFIIGRFLQGSAICSLVVAGYASIHELLDHKQAIITLAWMSNITVLAPAFGPLLGGIILTFMHWKFIFYSQSLWAFITIALLFKFMPESNPPSKQHPIHLKILFKNYAGILLNKRFYLDMLSFCFLFSGMIAWITAGPFIVINEFKKSVLMFGVYQACIFCSFILGTRTVSILIHKTSIDNIINLGLAILLSGALLSIPLALFMPHHLIGMIISLMIFAGGSGLVFSPLNRLSIEACTEPMGARVAISSLCMSAFAAVGSILVTIFYDKTLLSVSLIIASVASIACFIQWKLMPNRNHLPLKLDN